MVLVYIFLFHLPVLLHLSLYTWELPLDICCEGKLLQFTPVLYPLGSNLLQPSSFLLMVHIS